MGLRLREYACSAPPPALTPTLPRVYATLWLACACTSLVAVALTESISRPSSSALVSSALIERSGDEHTAEIQSLLTSSLKPEP